MLILFKLTILLSALLIFWVQPMVSKSVLPLFGGSPAVWTTAMLFFQSCLLLGYLYSHYAVRRLKTLSQLILHSLMLIFSLPLLLVFIRLPLVVSVNGMSSPVAELLKVLGLVIAYPFVIASASSPLLQFWFSQAGAEGADDPYFLYSASNIGSFLALLSFPLLLEPLFSSSQQRILWTLLYLALFALLISCGLLTGRRLPQKDLRPIENKETKGKSPGWRRRLNWLLLSFIPSSLMLAVTNHLSSDIASIPLLWVIPLSLYLLSFVIVFARRPLFSDMAVDGFLPGLVLLVVFIMLTGIDQPLWLVLLAAKRAKQLIRGSRKRIDLKAENHLTIALEELRQGKVNFAVIEQEELAPLEQDQQEENGTLETEESSPRNEEETEILDSLTE